MSLPSSRRTLWRFLAMVAAGVLVLWLAWQWLPVAEWIREGMAFVSDLGHWGLLAFWFIYVVAAILGVPRTPLNVGAGILFSYPLALGVVLVSAFTAFIATFQIARHLARDWVEKRIRRVPIADQIMDMVEEESFKMVFLIRLNPFVPAVLKGYGFGTTSIPMRTYLTASVLGFLPLGAVHVYLGWLGGVAMMESDSRPDEWQLAMLVGGAVVSVILVAVVTWYAHRAIHKRSPAPSAA